jgi:hypothetical protein
LVLWLSTQLPGVYAQASAACRVSLVSAPRRTSEHLAQSRQGSLNSPAPCLSMRRTVDARVPLQTRCRHAYHAIDLRSASTKSASMALLAKSQNLVDGFQAAELHSTALRNELQARNEQWQSHQTDNFTHHSGDSWQSFAYSSSDVARLDQEVKEHKVGMPQAAAAADLANSKQSPICPTSSSRGRNPMSSDASSSTYSSRTRSTTSRKLKMQPWVRPVCLLGPN